MVFATSYWGKLILLIVQFPRASFPSLARFHSVSFWISANWSGMSSLRRRSQIIVLLTTLSSLYWQTWDILHLLAGKLQNLSKCFYFAILKSWMQCALPFPSVAVLLDRSQITFSLCFVIKRCYWKHFDVTRDIPAAKDCLLQGSRSRVKHLTPGALIDHT